MAELDPTLEAEDKVLVPDPASPTPTVRPLDRKQFIGFS